MEEVKWTHKGWFLLCPVKIAEIDSECPILEPRPEFLGFWFWINEQLQHALIGVLSLMSPDYEPNFVIKVTGEYE